MELQLVTFEQAKALKKLGFPQEQFIQTLDKYYEPGGMFELVPWYAKPSLELVAKWLREEKDIILLPTPMVKWSESEEKYYSPHYESCYTNWNSPTHGTLKEKDKYGNFNPIEFATYEEALSAGITKAIEILNKDEQVN